MEAALSCWCGKKDIITGSLISTELSDKRYDLSPRNNFRESKVIYGDEARQYLEKHGRLDLFNLGYRKFKMIGDIIYHEHTSPTMFDFNEETRDFLKISMVRNPFDLMVSYYWWNYFSPIDDSVISFNREELLAKKRERENVELAPSPEDTIRDLRVKFEKWLNIKAFVSQQPRPAYGEETVARWFSSWSNEFFENDNIDFFIRFENINKDYEILCNHICKDPVEIPKFKSKIRKSEFSYQDYYTCKTQKTIQQLFQSTIDKFGYRF